MANFQFMYMHFDNNIQGLFSKIGEGAFPINLGKNIYNSSKRERKHLM